jgi:hypothetical protein
VIRELFIDRTGKRCIQGVARECAKGARAHPLEKKWLEGSTGLKNDPQGREIFPLAGTPVGKFLAMLLDVSLHIYEPPMSCGPIIYSVLSIIYLFLAALQKVLIFRKPNSFYNKLIHEFYHQNLLSFFE